ncbi:hypothetical protein ACFQ71_39215 [Streptomyces sp. NPDC056534]|uniref:hypothetical protein n=1 Tax=Streptomyces sp. NPDC056534 TaxID=3345857 RepID=UPI0036B6576A
MVTAFRFPLDHPAFVTVRCSLCRNTGPFAALDTSLIPLHVAVRRHLTNVHPGAADDAFTIEPVRTLRGWSGTQTPHEWQAFPPAW